MSTLFLVEVFLDGSPRYLEVTRGRDERGALFDGRVTIIQRDADYEHSGVVEIRAEVLDAVCEWWSEHRERML